jgi:hypothetical protein
MSILSSSALAGDLLSIHKIETQAFFTIPHNEPVVDDKVARYRLTGRIEVDLWRFRGEYEGILWGLNTWKTPDQVGHGFPDAWRGSDWNIERFKFYQNSALMFDITGEKNLWVRAEASQFWYPDLPQGRLTGYENSSNYWLQLGIRWTIVSDGKN